MKEELYNEQQHSTAQHSTAQHSTAQPIAYVINLDRQPERLFSFYQQPDSHIFQRLPAVDKKILELLGSPDYYFNTEFIQQHILRSVTFGEIGCTLSHIKAWKLISENSQLSDDDFAIVAEDDVKLIDNFLYHIKSLLPIFVKMDVDIIKLQKLGVFKLLLDNNVQGYFPKKREDVDDSGSALYLIRKSKACALVKQLSAEKPYWLADEFSLFCSLDKIFVLSDLLGYIPNDTTSDLEYDRQIARQSKI